MLKAGLEMHNISAKNHRSSFREPHEQRLMARRVSGRGEQYEAAIAKDIVVAVDELERMLLVKGNGVLSARGPLVFGSLHLHQRGSKHFNVPSVVRVTVGYGRELDV